MGQAEIKRERVCVGGGDDEIFFHFTNNSSNKIYDMVLPYYRAHVYLDAILR